MKFYQYINEAEKYFYRWCNLGEIAKIFNGKRPTSLDVTDKKNFYFSSQSGRPKVGKGWISEVYVKLYLNADTLKKLGWQRDKQAKGEGLWRPKGITLDKNILKQYLKAIEKIEIHEWPKDTKEEISSWIKFRLDNVKIEFKGRVNEGLKVEDLPDFVNYLEGDDVTAQYFNPNNINVGPKFFKLPSKDMQKFVLIHEIGHEISDDLLENGKAFDWMDMGYYHGEFKGRKVYGLNGHTQPGEILAEAFAVFITEPSFLKKHYENLYNELRNVLKQSKYRELVKRAKEINKI